jgi:(5R)-carbapenem-3-carboxylate synthase
MQTLLRTGFGLSMKTNHFENLSVQNVKGLLKTKGFIIVKDIDLTRDKLLKITEQHGTLLEYLNEKKKVNYGNSKYIFDVDGSQNKRVRGRGELPIHADGGLLQTKVDQIFLYAHEIENMKFQGGTGIIDHKLAIDEMPIHLKRILEEEKFQTLGLEEPYYSNLTDDDWYDIPVFTDLGWCRKMLIYFNYEKSNEASWKTRIKGFSDTETNQFFQELKKFLLNYQRYCYLHFWEKKDLLIMDNRRVIHYREPFDLNVKRIIFRTQATE